MCTPDLGENEYDNMAVPSNWPDHLEGAVQCINNRILPNLKYSANELLLGIVVNARTTPSEILAEPMVQEVDLQMAYVNNQQFNGYAQILDHAQQWKAAFDKEVLAHPPQEVIFRAGELVQVYHSDLDYTFSTERKLLPKFSTPRQITNRNQNSYQLETQEGLPIGGRFSSR